MKKRIHRRKFIKGVAVAGTVSAIASCGKAPSRFRFLTASEANLVDLISEQIIPSDEDPGARWAGVVNFIDKQLMGPYQRFQEDYRTGLVGVEETSQQMYKAAFGALNWDQQTTVLQALESGKAKGATWQARSSAEFFALIRDHCMQGFYGSPRHGGNRDYVSFRMMGIDYPQFLGQNRYKKA